MSHDLTGKDMADNVRGALAGPPNPLTPAQLKARHAALIEEIADARVNGDNPDKVRLLEAQAQALKARIDRDRKDTGEQVKEAPIGSEDMQEWLQLNAKEEEKEPDIAPPPADELAQ